MSSSLPPFEPLPPASSEPEGAPTPEASVTPPGTPVFAPVHLPPVPPPVDASAAAATDPVADAPVTPQVAAPDAERTDLHADTAADIAADVAEPDGQMDRMRAFRMPVFVGVGLGLVAFAILVATRSDLRAAPGVALQPSDAAAAVAPLRPPDPNEPYTFAGLDIHPDRLHRQYLGGAFSGADADTPTARDFRWRLDMYRKAYGQDDNYTIRVFDDRDGRILDVQSLEGARGAFELPGGGTNWDAINSQRRLLSTQLRDKWEARGVPRAAIVIRWGYADQTREARERDNRYVAYEVNLARRLGLSVLATEIGTVETFNQDQLVSPVGARSRFQMMPDIMRMFDVEQYALPLAMGGTVQVREELHPLLAMEPSLMLVRAYANAVGHELPGISAYHTGPGNLFKLYREYLRAHPGLQNTRGKHVSDAYMWGVTDGFERVDEVSSFGPQSRVYLLKAYGALRATENQVVDPDESFRGERVQIRAGQTVTLAQILDALAPHQRRLEWGPADSGSLYQRFRELNPHIQLPLGGGSDVPSIGNLRLTASAGNVPVRFFLPLGATAVLQRVGLNVIGEATPFDGRTYLLAEGEQTPTDRAYAALVEDTGRFGFTRANASRLNVLHDRMQALAEQNPNSRYRQTQAKIIRIHRSVWRTAGFRDLMATTETLLSVNPLVNLSRQPIALGSRDSAAARRRTPITPITPRPPRIEDTVQY